MSSALKAISRRVKVLKKKHPNAKHRTLQKQAGKEYKAGKLKGTAVRKKTVRKKRVVRKKVVRRVSVVPRKKTVRRKTRRRVGAVSVAAIVPRHKRRHSVKRVVRRRRVGAKSDWLIPAVTIVGVGAALWYISSRKQNNTVIVPTGNVVRDSQAQQILALVSAGTATATQIANLIANLNNKSDAEVQQIYDNVHQGVISNDLYA